MPFRGRTELDVENLSDCERAFPGGVKDEGGNKEIRAAFMEIKWWRRTRA